MGMGPGVRTSLGYGGIACVLQTQFSSFFNWDVKAETSDVNHDL